MINNDQHTVTCLKGTRARRWKCTCTYAPGCTCGAEGSADHDDTCVYRADPDLDETWDGPTVRPSDFNA